MQISPVIKKETKRIAIGELILCAVMVVIFALFKKFDYTVILGAIIGGCFAVLNFYMLAMTVQKATAGDEATAKLKMRSSYMVRMFMTFLFGVAAILLPYFNWVSTLLPLIFPRITIFLMYLLKIESKEEE